LIERCLFLAAKMDQGFRIKKDIEEYNRIINLYLREIEKTGERESFLR
jgi:hypothetical protein